MLIVDALKGKKLPSEKLKHIRAKIGQNLPKSGRRIMQSLRARARRCARGLIFFTISSELKFHGSAEPGSRICPGACQPVCQFAWSLQKHVFCDKFWSSWFDGLPFRIKYNLHGGCFSQYFISEKDLKRGKKEGIFYLGACEVARSLQARLAWILEPGCRKIIKIQPTVAEFCVKKHFPIVNANPM